MGESARVLRSFLTAGLSVALVGAVVSVVLLAARRGRPGRRLARPVGRSSDGLLVIAGFLALLVSQFVAQTFFPPLWGPVVVDPALAGVLLSLIALQGGRNPFPAQGWARNFVAGYLTWLLVTPVVYVVFVLATKGNEWLMDRPPDKHPLIPAVEQAGPWGWVLLLLQTILLAPVVEELVFRGLLLPWLVQSRPKAPQTAVTLPPILRPTMILGLAIGVAMLLHSGGLAKAMEAGDRREVANHLVPAAFFLILLPIDLFLPRVRPLRRFLRIRSVQHARAIWASSALFAAVHANVWPSPVPLFVLALGLGYLYLRTRTLIGPVVVHGLFNAVSAIYLLLGGPA